MLYLNNPESDYGRLKARLPEFSDKQKLEVKLYQDRIIIRDLDN